MTLVLKLVPVFGNNVVANNTISKHSELANRLTRPCILVLVLFIRFNIQIKL